jgi:hypothetical protein
MQRAVGVFITVLILVTSGAAHAFGQDPRATPQASALDDLQQRLAGYLALRAELATRLKPLSTTASAAELRARQESLAAAVREVRRDARPGDLIPAPGADLIRRAVTDDLTQRSAAEKRGALAEVPDGPPPVINRTYPADLPLATVPPLLLVHLPPLPDNLQYRYYARHMVLLDGDVEIILDYVLNVLPPH